MAGDWIKMRADLRDDPAVFRLAEVLGLDELHVIGSLFCFWAWADKHTVDGHVDGATSRLVDKVSMVHGFADALVLVGWLKLDERGIQIPNFERHNGQSAKDRGLKNARQNRWRTNKNKDLDGVNCVDGSVDGHASTNASTREEKRREENTTSSLRSEVDTPRKRSAPSVKPLAAVDDLVQAGFTPETAAEFIAHKASKKAPLTHRAWRDHLAEAKKAGWTPVQAADKVMAKGWKGFEASYVADEKAQAAQPQAMSFAERDELARRRRWEEMTGRTWPTETNVLAGEIIEMERRHEPISQSH